MSRAVPFTPENLITLLAMIPEEKRSFISYLQGRCRKAHISEILAALVMTPKDYDSWTGKPICEQAEKLLKASADKGGFFCLSPSEEAGRLEDVIKAAQAGDQLLEEARRENEALKEEVEELKKKLDDAQEASRRLAIHVIVLAAADVSRGASCRED